MFTGIIEGTGSVRRVQGRGGRRRLEVQASFSIRGTKLGDSIAVDGCCLTVTGLKRRRFWADVSPETLSRTTLAQLKPGAEVNLERALKAGDRLGGHFVQGHVDGVGKILENRAAHSGGEIYHILSVQMPKELMPFILEKGSITVDGISLTVNYWKKDWISLCIIPHTRARTALTRKKVGARVNLEADILLKYLNQLVNSRYRRGEK